MGKSKRVTSDVLKDDLQTVERLWKRLETMQRQYRPWGGRHDAPLGKLYELCAAAELALLGQAEAGVYELGGPDVMTMRLEAGS